MKTAIIYLQKIVTLIFL